VRGLAILAGFALVGLTGAEWCGAAIDWEGPGASGYGPLADVTAWQALTWEP
jgi:hypothetical protein